VQVAPEQTSADAGALDGERKTVTALFADIKGSMELIEDLDPEEARTLIDPALKLMMDAVHRYEGYVAQSTGDGIFALFGAPLAHEDDPQQPCTPLARCRRTSNVTPTGYASRDSRRYRFGWESTAEK
jgi:class 3 adenylate cyclase